MTHHTTANVTVIGGGIVGLATAHALLRSGVDGVRVVEKEHATAQHQSTHNSGVLHAGLQYTPGSEKRYAKSVTEVCVCDWASSSSRKPP